MGKILSREEWRRREKIKNIIMIVAAFILMIIIIIFITFFIVDALQGDSEKGNTEIGNSETDNLTEAITILSDKIVIKNDYLTPNPFSRPQTSLSQVKGVVIHYTANPGTSAKSNRSYFEGLAEKQTTSVSSHYIIGLEGEILQCIPLTEIAYASNERNNDTIAIECCHPDETGEFNDETYKSLVTLVANLCIEFDLKEEEIIRHYDVNEKPCPLYYVEHVDAWTKLKADVTEEMKQIESGV